MTTDYATPADDKVNEALEAAESLRDTLREVLDGDLEGHDQYDQEFVSHLATFESWATLIARRLK